MFQAPDKKTMRVGETELIVEIADTDILRAKGLSGRKNLNENSGMLFVYDKPEIRRFWMKDVYFDLDVLWISDNMVVGIEENVLFEQKNGDIARFQSKMASDMVLEVNKGWIAKNGVKIGQIVDIIED